MSSLFKKGSIFFLACCCYTMLMAQQVNVTGRVIDEEGGLPLAGVTISVKGQQIATTSNQEGVYTINAPASAVLVFTYSGYLSEEISVESRTVLNVELKADIQKLSEVVVVGYGQQNRNKLSGSVASVDQNAMKSVPRTSAGTVLQGTVPGLRVQQTTGNPGASPTISFRGGTNFNGSGSPLIVIDGVIVPSLYGVNMSDVETIDLLKDAASTAIYGARAADGVVLITTKKGKKGKSQVTYNYRSAKNFIRRNPVQLLSAADYILWNRRAVATRYETAVLDNNTSEMNATINFLSGAFGWSTNTGFRNPDGLYSTQLVTDANRHFLSDAAWSLLVDKNPINPSQTDSLIYRQTSQRALEDLIMQDSRLEEHNINFSGANDQGSFALSLGTIKDVGIVVGSSLKRMTANFNGALNVNKDFKITLNISGYSDDARPSYVTADNAGGLTGGLLQRFAAIAPTVRLTHDLTGEMLPGVDGGTLGNPLYLKDKFIRASKEQRISGSVGVEYSLLPSLKFLASASGFMRFGLDEAFNKQYRNGTAGALIATRNASFANDRVFQYSYNAFLQYNKAIQKHSLNVLAGAEYYNIESYTNSGAATGAATDFIPYLSASTLANGIPRSAFSGWNRLASLIGRVNYDYDNKYLLTFNMRYDGTSKLADNRYGIFPGISVGWNLHNEDFFTDSKVRNYIQSIKPRISWGQNGSISPIGDFATAAVYANAAIYDGNAGFVPNSLVNAALKWERASSLNFGIDLGFLNNRITLIGDYFIRNVYDKITSMPIPVWTGYSAFTTNLGQLQNKGIELEIRANIIRPKEKDGLRWDVSANFYHVKNFAVRLPENGLERNRQSTIQVWDPVSSQLVQVGGLQEGLRIGLDEIWAPVYDGIYLTQNDLNKDANIYNSYLPTNNKRIKLLGDARWRDIDKNDTIDFRDRVYVGRTTPTVQGGFSTVVNWKSFSLYVQTDYSLGFMVLNQIRLRGLSQVQGSQNSTAEVLNTWSPDNTSGTLPRYSFGNYNRNYFQDAAGASTTFANFYEKGDYLALREVTLSYETPARLLQQFLKGRIKGVRVYLAGSNLAYFTKYSGTFAEDGGNDVGKFPIPRRLTLGITATL